MNHQLKKIWLEFTDKFGTTPIHPQFIIKKYEKEVITDNLRFLKGSLIDVGCGTQPYKKIISKYVSTYISVDHPQISKMYPTENKPDLLASAEKIPFKDGSFDTVLLLQVIEHLKKPEIALIETYRILKKNGIVIISVPFMYPLHDEPNDYFRFTHYALKQLLKNSNLRILKLYPQGNFLDFLYLSIIEIVLYNYKKIINLKNILLRILLIILFSFITYPIIFAVNLLFFLINSFKFIFQLGPNYFMPINFVIIARKS